MSLTGSRFSLEKASNRIAPIKSQTNENEQNDYPTTTPIISLRLIHIVIKWLGLAAWLDVAFGERLNFLPSLGDSG